MTLKTTRAENKRLVHEALESVFNLKRYDAIERHFAPEFVLHGPEDGREVAGRSAFRAYVKDLIRAFPDFTIVREDELGERELVAIRLTFAGTHCDEYLDVPATGAQVAVPAMLLLRFEGGKIAEGWLHLDIDSLRRQLETEAAR